MSAATESFLDQLEAAATPAVIGTKKAAKALAPSDIKTSQQDKLADMGAYKRRQKKMEKGLLNQEVEIEEEEIAKGEDTSKENYPGAMKRYPMQLDKDEDDGEWITGDPDLPIDWEFKGDPIKKAYKQIKKDRSTVTKKGDTTVKGALGELASLFQGITGQELEPEEPKSLEPIPLPEPAAIVPYIDPKIIEEATNELQALFTEMSGNELFGERLGEEEVIEIPVTPLETFDISEVSDVASRIFGAHKVLPDTTLYNPSDVKHTQVVQDVDDLLEKHKEDLPEEQYQILKTDAADKTADYLSKLNLNEFEVPNSMPLTGANMPLVSSPQFTMAVSGILRKMMATGPGTGVVEISELDDVDTSNISVTDKFLAWDASVSKFVASSGGAAGDITGVTAGTGLSGGGDTGTVTINLDPVTVALGGTGITAAAKGSVLIANAANTFSALSGSTDGDVLTYSSGTDTISWSGSVDGGTY